MSEDVILDVTADFILDSKENLKLALEVERAMPTVREHYVKTTLEVVAERFPGPEWTFDRSYMQDVMAKDAGLVLSSSAWKTSQGGAAIWLGSDKPNWENVWIGLYFTGGSQQKVETIKQTVEELTKSEFTFDESKDEPGVYKYLEGELRNWSGRQFLTRIISDDDGLDQIAKEISAELEEVDKFLRSLPQ